jgi:hypothetical protein
MIYCVDDRHGTPCPQPPNGARCEACDDEDCDPTATVEAETSQEAARSAGWSEEYIAEMEGGH